MEEARVHLKLFLQFSLKTQCLFLSGNSSSQYSPKAQVPVTLNWKACISWNSHVQLDVSLGQLLGIEFPSIDSNMTVLEP